jgi:hypothetical protein
MGAIGVRRWRTQHSELPVPLPERPTDESIVDVANIHCSLRARCRVVEFGWMPG